MIGFGWVGFYGISTSVGYLMPNPLYRYILNIDMICKHILSITFLNNPGLFCSQLNSFKYCYITVTIQHQSFACICHLFYLTHRSDPIRVDLGAMAMKGTLHSPKLQGWSLAISLFNAISRTLIAGGGLTPLPRCSQCILQPQLTGLHSFGMCYIDCSCGKVNINRDIHIMKNSVTGN